MSARKKCLRCRGTGDWMPGRICFGCNGVGSTKVPTADERRAAKQAHLAETRASLEGEVAGRDRLLAKGRRTTHLEPRISQLAALVMKLESELAS